MALAWKLLRRGLNVRNLRRYSSHSKAWRILVLGAPGVGKGTYGRILANELNAQIMTSGDLLRAHSEENKDTLEGKYLKQCIESGELVSDSFTISFMLAQLHNMTTSFILDGFPRTKLQMERIHIEYGVDLAIHFTLDEDILITKALGRRVCPNTSCGANFNIADINDPKRGIVMPSMKPRTSGVCDECNTKLVTRVDDTKDVIENRLVIHNEQIAPVIEFCEEEGILLEFAIKTGLNDMPHISAKVKEFLGLFN